MGLKFKELVVKEEISISSLKGKILAVDAMNILYQFLTTIRAPDGSALTDKKGRVTSHLIGLFNRTTSLMEEGLKLVFVFDGKAPQIKQRTWERRSKIKQEAALKLREATAAGEEAEMRKFAARTAVLTNDMINDAKRVITALGLPIVQAASEGEAQTAFMVKQGDAYASISQDYDNLIFSCPRLVRNLSIAGKRKRAGKYAFQKVNPELIELPKVLRHLSLTQDQLIVLAILVGTDYNPAGIKGIGPKKGLALVRSTPDFTTLFAEAGWNEQYPELSWQEVFDTIKDMPVNKSYSLEWQKPDRKKLVKLLAEEYNFSEERVNSKLDKLEEKQTADQQKGLASFFK